uniref:Uncharacterized protein n=1 Tax=Arundo donax TaxID=35708 RepID=A0A0A9ER86_ARUDO
MNVGSQPNAGTRPQCLMPDSKANSLYSTSISSKVSMCSLTKLMGTARRLFTPFCPSSIIVSSVYGFSHSTGPTRL